MAEEARRVNVEVLWRRQVRDGAATGEISIKQGFRTAE